MDTTLPGQSGTLQSTSKQGCSSPIIFILFLGWIGIVTFWRNISILFLTFSPGLDIRPASVQSSLMMILLLGLPLLPLARFWKNPRYRSIFKGWLLATGLIIVLLPVQFVGQTGLQAQALLHILFAGIYSLFLLFLNRKQSNQAGLRIQPGQRIKPSSMPKLLAAVLPATLVVYPWLSWGALGSPLDTLLQVSAALGLGLAAALLIDRFLALPLRSHPTNPVQDFFLGGAGISAALLIVAGGTGFSFGGMQLLLMLALPAWGWVLWWLVNPQPESQSTTGVLPLALVIGLLAAAPMTLVDPHELVLVISAQPGEILQWAMLEAAVSGLAGLVSGGLFFFIVFLSNRARGREPQPAGSQAWIRLPLLFALAAAWLTAGWIYFSTGQPGFHGDALFVIMREQAGLSSAVGIQDYTARRQFVYNSLVETANTTQADLRRALDRFSIPYTPYYLENGMSVVGSPLLRLWLASRPEVDRVLDNPRLRPLPESPAPATGVQSAPAAPLWNLTMLGADRVWEEFGVSGEGIVVGQSDSGAQADHPELAASYRGQDGQQDYNWYDPWNGTSSPIDISGHGTHTLGSILGGNTGIAPGATWFGCVNLARNLANPALYLDCLQFMLAPFPAGGDPLVDGDPARGAHILNNSWSCPELEGCDLTALEHAVSALRSAGVFVVVSAGNEGPACETIASPPALFEDAYSVGAVDQSGLLADFSSRGPVTADGSGRAKPDIVAPGVAVLSAFPGSTYQSLSGTSMAGPHVVGVVALIWSANPALIGDIDRTEQILNQTAQPYPGTLPFCAGSAGGLSTTVGHGIVDAYSAVQRAIQEGK